MSHLGPDSVANKFSGMVKRCADSGFDLASGLVEVVPTAHYFMGGIVVDTDTRTELPGLYVAGEDAGGAHGSNRLGGNGVANSTVYGGIAGDVMARDALQETSLRDPDEALLEAEIARARYPFSKKPGNIHDLRDKLKEIMWNDVGIMRTAEGLQRAISDIRELQAELMETGLADHNMNFNLTWHDWMNMRSLVEISETIATAALSRENSRGAHFREDFPEEGDLPSSYFTLTRQKNGNLDVVRKNVAFTIIKPGESLVEDMSPIATEEQ